MQKLDMIAKFKYVCVCGWSECRIQLLNPRSTVSVLYDHPSKLGKKAYNGSAQSFVNLDKGRLSDLSPWIGFECDENRGDAVELFVDDFERLGDGHSGHHRVRRRNCGDDVARHRCKKNPLFCKACNFQTSLSA